ncbi:uncharacterized protein LOC129796424 [Lutzomyia longipalpis]|uniref:Uncharacterized protein n=1 Tax=Lutzomyia longipalpis TaxID=7200 RepID=A0A1B0CD61_LUTLO|nr:uncharacterized protein LOC129796424 [Lutzomyia longipalpis]
MENELMNALTELNGLKNPESTTTTTSSFVRDTGFVFYTSATEVSKSHGRVVMSPKYVSKIYSSPRRCPGTPLRVRPYTVPERHRTRSESLDPNSGDYQDTITIVTDTLSSSVCMSSSGAHPTPTSSTMMDTFDPAMQTMEIAATTGGSSTRRLDSCRPLKKSKSLEDVRVENLAGSQLSHEMEFVSSRIQKLKVQEY